MGPFVDLLSAFSALNNSLILFRNASVIFIGSNINRFIMRTALQTYMNPLKAEMATASRFYNVRLSTNSLIAYAHSTHRQPNIHQ